MVYNTVQSIESQQIIWRSMSFLSSRLMFMPSKGGEKQQPQNEARSKVDWENVAS
jgi:hypothetical protein